MVNAHPFISIVILGAVNEMCNYMGKTYHRRKKKVALIKVKDQSFLRIYNADSLNIRSLYIYLKFNYLVQFNLFVKFKQ